MSIEAMTAVKECIALQPAEKFILLAMASYADQDGASIYPSHETIALWTGYHRTTIVDITQRLIKRGILQLVGKQARGQNEYMLNLDQLAALSVLEPLKHLKAIKDKRKPRLVTPPPQPDNSPEIDAQPTPERLETEPKAKTMSARLQGMSATPTVLMFNKRFKTKRFKDLINLRATPEKNLSGNQPKNIVLDPGIKNSQSGIPKPPNYELFKVAYDKHAKNADKHTWGKVQVQDMADLVREFNAAGVTPEDFTAAITYQDNSPKDYKASGPLSYRTMAYSQKTKRLTGYYPRVNHNHPAYKPAVNQAATGTGWVATESQFYSPDPEAEIITGLKPNLNLYAAAILDIYREKTGKSYSPVSVDLETIALWERQPFEIEDYKNALDKMGAAMGLDRINSPVACEYYLKIAKQERINPGTYKSLDDLRGYKMPSMVGIGV